VPGLDLTGPAEQPAHAALAATGKLAREHASIGSVWFQNSIRGAAGLALAVYIAQRSGLHHSFWVVLGTLSVLRSNGLGTGWSILSALAGTAVGIVIGALVVIAIGTHQGVLWGVLPVAVLLAAYAPRAISFAAGQAGFTVVLFVLFNLIQPVGWKVGLVRVEDVAIGFAICLGVGLLFWPRGAASRLRKDLAGAYARGTDYVVATARQVIEGKGSEEASGAALTADAAIHRLDDAFRQYLAERSATKVNVEDVAALVGGASRVRRAAQSLAALGRIADGEPRPARCGQNSTANSKRSSLGSSPSGMHSWPAARCCRRTFATSKAGPDFCRAYAKLPVSATTRRSTPRSCCSGRASISTTCGTSRPTSASAQTPPVPRRSTMERYGG